MNESKWRRRRDLVSWLWLLDHESIWNHFSSVSSMLGDFAEISIVEVERRSEEIDRFVLPDRKDALHTRLQSGEDIRNVYLTLSLSCAEESGEAFHIENGATVTLFGEDSQGSKAMVDLALHVDVHDTESLVTDEELAQANGPRLTRFLTRVSAYATRLDSMETEFAPNAYELGFRVSPDG